MHFENRGTQDVSRLHVEEFLWSLDNEDVTILQNAQYDKFLNDEEKELWENE
jgi:hypothetical protein